MPTVARARYTGNARSHSRPCPSGSVYHFQNRPSPAVDDWVAVDTTEDAEYLDEGVPDSVIEVDWTPSGKAQDAAEDAVEGVASVADQMRQWGYDRKQSMAQRLREAGVIDEDFALNSSEDELEAELSEHAQQLAEAMED